MLTYFGDFPGYNTTPLTERYRLIRQAGFDGTLVWWDVEDQYDYREQPRLARAAGLYVENMHVSFDNANDFWHDSPAGQAVFDYYMQCLQDCAAYDIPAMVMHTGRSGDPLPPMSGIGGERMRRMADTAERLGVNIAVENQCAADKIERAIEILSMIDSPRLGMCYDSGHGNVRDSRGLGKEMFSRFGHRLKALHLHDNDGSSDQHRLPFDVAQSGVDWPALMRQIAETGYSGPTTLEVDDKPAFYSGISAEEFLAAAFDRVKKLEALRRI